MFDTPLRINFGSDNSFVRTLDAIGSISVIGVQINDPLALTGAGVSVIERGECNSLAVELPSRRPCTLTCRLLLETFRSLDDTID